MMMFVTGCIVLWGAINLVAYLAFRIDKSLARTDKRRIPEQTLLALAMFGGSIGAKIAQKRFRHKTYKEPFRSTLNLICVLHVLVVIAGLIWLLGYGPAITDRVLGFIQAPN